jgi:hypothetical protein
MRQSILSSFAARLALRERRWQKVLDRKTVKTAANGVVTLPRRLRGDVGEGFFRFSRCLSQQEVRATLGMLRFA